LATSASFIPSAGLLTANFAPDAAATHCPSMNASVRNSEPSASGGIPTFCNMALSCKQIPAIRILRSGSRIAPMSSGYTLPGQAFLS
jgi:hypothetical protein